MSEAYIGDVIRQKREALGLTQADLADGICSVVSISRIESGIQSPKLPLLRAILGRLDLPENRYFLWAFNAEQHTEFLLKRMDALVAQYEKNSTDENRIRKEVSQIVEELKADTIHFDVFTQQRIVCAQLTLGKEGRPYTPLEKREKLFSVIRMTCPKFDVHNIAKGRYSTFEIRILNQLGITYLLEPNKSEAASFFQQLYTYVKKNFQEIPIAKSYLCPIISNYVRSLMLEEQYAQAICLAEEGRRLCLENSYYFPLVEFLDELAEANCFLRKPDRGREFFLHAYAFAVITEDKVAEQAISDDMKRHLGITPSLQLVSHEAD
ncbi:helix-turn-helix transcriptional regulator [Pseudoflavonifractor sp. MSJ-30]|uniref:helix-turn-helix domain-containing protein n=1 Tax=Pseudoflavonifractor sp. MSJ-30 TaxID=2841525 RepID=UPI001C11C2A0|nr:helix-turn-helix transcriptional regulator [Pseudoflavonifractor sp. MSJ-30]MBU5452958.1 helix-turn-helix transcriptional regulator [Pseudoflavonifractor sp. MSJ-30]